MNLLNLSILPPNQIQNDSNLPLWNEFFHPIYQQLFQLIDPSAPHYPHIDFDSFKNNVETILRVLNEEQIKSLRKLGNGNIGKAEWLKAPEHRAMMVFFWSYPEFANLLTNIHLLSDISIKAAETCLQIKIDATNFINAKQFIDKINRERWVRRQTFSEEQSGNSNLGGVSETLLEMAMNKLIDGVNFFKTTNNKIQSYGDFVLMCLPNNLWLSVKSNFARERLLASGYTTDILGVGFFEEKDEFTSLSKIRNFQRVGFLAMYLPDIPVSEAQVTAGTNTFQEVHEFYETNNINLPLNINGTPFLRPLSGLHQDLSKILDVVDISNRTTIGF